jgi:ribosomal protein S18 acetylase RimI-like enzyme
MTQVRVVPCRPCDLEPLLGEMAAFNALEAIPWTADTARPAVARLLTSPDLGAAAWLLEGEARRGYCVLTWGYDLEWQGRDAILTELYLQPDARGRGLGTRVMPLVFDLARRHDVRAVHLMVRPDNASAVRLYRRAGFEVPPRTFMTKVLDRA